MQKLHLVGFTTDLDGLILGARKGAKSGSFVVPLDERLIHTIEEALHLREEQRAEEGGPPAPVPEAFRRTDRVESTLSVREIQERLRTGQSVEAVAAAAGVEPEWIDRFAAPVVAEQARVVERARGLVYDKPRFGLSRLPLGASVARNIAQRGVRLADDEFEGGWSAYQVQDGLWGVRFRYVSRGRPQEAEWLLDLDDDALTSNNRLAAQLGHVGRAARRPPRATPAKATSARKGTAKRAASKKRAAKKRPAKKAPARKRPAKKSTVKRRAPLKKRAPAKKRSPSKKRSPAKKRAPAKKRTPAKKKAPARKSAPRTATAKRTPARRASSSKPAAKRAPAKKAPAEVASRRARKAATKKGASTESAAKRRPGRTSATGLTTPATSAAAPGRDDTALPNPRRPADSPSAPPVAAASAASMLLPVATHPVATRPVATRPVDRGNGRAAAEEATPPSKPPPTVKVSSAVFREDLVRRVAPGDRQPRARNRQRRRAQPLRAR